MKRSTLTALFVFGFLFHPSDARSQVRISGVSLDDTIEQTTAIVEKRGFKCRSPDFGGIKLATFIGARKMPSSDIIFEKE